MPQTNSASIIPMDDLIAKHAEDINGFSKNTAIIKSSSAIVSIIASSLLILTIFRSPKRLSTTYHRILLGMSISDILYSLSLSTFQALHPSDVNYRVWNAKGNQATCNAEGFISSLGFVATLTYSCSLNIYYLASVKYNKTDTYICTKIEPFLHCIPIFIALVSSIISLVNQNYNNSGFGNCTEPIYNPEHCIGYDEGDIRDGFEIPCGQGRNAELFGMIVFLLLIAPPTTMAVSLGMIHRSVANQEKRLARYGVGALNPSAQQTSGDDAGERVNEGNGHQSGSAISLKRKFGRQESSNPHTGGGDNSNSRAVKQKARAYTIAYLLAWGWIYIYAIVMVAGVEDAVALFYMLSFFNPLQGLFNFIVYLHPTAMKVKISPGRNVSWCQAFGIAFWSGINGPKKKTHNPPVHVAGNNNSPHQGGDIKENSPAAPHNKGATGVTDTAGNTTGLHTNYNRKSIDIEEEKTEIQAPQDNDDWNDNAFESN